MDIKLNLSYSASIMLDAYRDLLCSDYYAGIIGLDLNLVWKTFKEIHQAY